MPKILKIKKLELKVLCDCGETFIAGLKRGTICPRCSTDVHIVIAVKKPEPPGEAQQIINVARMSGKLLKDGVMT